jgi:hypothetical protein
MTIYHQTIKKGGLVMRKTLLTALVFCFLVNFSTISKAETNCGEPLDGVWVLSLSKQGSIERCSVNASNGWMFVYCPESDTMLQGNPYKGSLENLSTGETYTFSKFKVSRFGVLSGIGKTSSEVKFKMNGIKFPSLISTSPW